MDIPDGVTGITPSWLNSALGLADDEAVVSVDATPLGTGQMSDSYRLRTSHRDGTTATSVAKLPSTDQSSRSAGRLMRAYEKEVRFYQQLAGSLPVHTPGVRVAEIDLVSGDFVLVLEDLSRSVPGDQLAGTDPARAGAALSELVGLHAPRWGDPALRDLDWLLGDRGPARDLMIGLLPGLWTGFLERYGDRIDDEVRHAGSTIFAHLPAFYAEAGPETIVHGDFRLDNLLFDPTDGSVTVLDWQTCTVGAGPADAAYFVGAGLVPELRRDAEVHLFDRYHRGLVDGGVKVDRSDCWTAYRRGSWAGLVMAVGASMLVQRTERGDEMFMVMAARHARHAIDLDAGDLLVG